MIPKRCGLGMAHRGAVDLNWNAAGSGPVWVGYARRNRRQSGDRRGHGPHGGSGNVIPTESWRASEHDSPLMPGIFNLKVNRACCNLSPQLQIAEDLRSHFHLQEPTERLEWSLWSCLGKKDIWPADLCTSDWAANVWERFSGSTFPYWEWTHAAQTTILAEEIMPLELAVPGCKLEAQCEHPRLSQCKTVWCMSKETPCLLPCWQLVPDFPPVKPWK